MKYRIHWNLFKKRFTGHTYLKCEHPDIILVEGEWTTELKPNKHNPRGFVVCDSSQVIHNPSETILDAYIKTERLKYDKENIRFNVDGGNGLVCDKTGCWLIAKKITSAHDHWFEEGYED